MYAEPLSRRVSSRLQSAAQSLRAVDPMPFVARLIDDTFPLPIGDPRYGGNALLPGAAPLEPQFVADKPQSLSFSLEPLGPGASGSDRRDTATLEMRRLVSDSFGGDALRWFDKSSEPWRGRAGSSALRYGAFFGSSFDRGGLQSANVTYESGGDRLGDVNPALMAMVGPVMAAMPGLQPIFTTLIAGRDYGAQRLTFLITNAMRVADLRPVMEGMGLGEKLASILQVVGLALGGRFDLPPGSTLLALGRGPAGAELELHIMLDAIPDVPPDFLSLLTLSLSERPRELTALERFMAAFTPEDDVWPGRFSILGIRVSPAGPPKVSLFLRPIEFEVPAAAAITPMQSIPAFA